jgi:tRNA-Thr(GGU) m(6)t(6)A37 methyltransferase TsaA
MKVLALIIGLFMATTVWAYEGRRIKLIEIGESSGLRQEIYPVHPEIGGEKGINFQQIGIFHTPYNQSTGAPRQGILEPETKAIIEIDKIYRKGLADLEKFDYIIVLYYFNITKTWSPTVNPPQSDHHFGVFATRSPKRPNPIGFSIVKLENVDLENGILTLSGIDAFEGTPVLDIKPYLPSVDIVHSSRNVVTEKELGHHDEKYIRDPTMYK